MKKIFALGLAAVMATATVGVSANVASAQPNGWNNEWKQNHNWKGNNWKANNWQGNGNWNGNNNWRRHHNNWRGGNYFLPFVLGGAIGYGLSQSYQEPYYGGSSYGSAHAQWCAERYRTYNPVTNTYFARRGVQAVCYSPYS